MSERQTMYRAFFFFNGLSMWNPESPCSTFHSSMKLSPCGNWVEATSRRPDGQGWETSRQEMNQYWQPTKELALAVVAPRLPALRFVVGPRCQRSDQHPQSCDCGD